MKQRTDSERECSFDWPGIHPDLGEGGERVHCGSRAVGIRDGRPACQVHLDQPARELQRKMGLWYGSSEEEWDAALDREEPDDDHPEE